MHQNRDRIESSDAQFRMSDVLLEKRLRFLQRGVPCVIHPLPCQLRHCLGSVFISPSTGHIRMSQPQDLQSNKSPVSALAYLWIDDPLVFGETPRQEQTTTSQNTSR